ncbi:hypothetical protein ACA910_021466 [Epithemia clementina (nom. ined.)]
MKRAATSELKTAEEERIQAEEDNPPTQLKDYNSDDEYVPLQQEQDAMQQGARRQLAGDNNSITTNEQECHKIRQLLEALQFLLPKEDPQNDEYYNNAEDLDMGFDLVSGREKGRREGIRL